jgi:antitoxin MazE
MITTIQKWGNSQGVRLPKALMEQIELSVGEAVELEILDDGIWIHKVQELPNTLDLLFEGYSGSYRSSEIDNGEPIGKEVF